MVLEGDLGLRGTSEPSNLPFTTVFIPGEGNLKA